jgi:hypothetical protein
MSQPRKDKNAMNETLLEIRKKKIEDKLQAIQSAIDVYEREPDSVDHWDDLKILKGNLSFQENLYEKVKAKNDFTEIASHLDALDGVASMIEKSIADFRLQDVETKIRQEVKWIEKFIDILQQNKETLTDGQKEGLSKLRNNLSSLIERELHLANFSPEKKAEKYEAIQSELNKKHNQISKLIDEQREQLASKKAAEQKQKEPRPSTQLTTTSQMMDKLEPADATSKVKAALAAKKAKAVRQQPRRSEEKAKRLVAKKRSALRRKSKQEEVQVDSVIHNSKRIR